MAFTYTPGNAALSGRPALWLNQSSTGMTWDGQQLVIVDDRRR